MTTTTNMSLHRVIAAIKDIETKLTMTAHTSFIYTAITEDATKIAEAKQKSQSDFDKVNSLIANLAELKAARNLANSVAQVTIAGVTMTIDEALAKKAAVPHKQALINTLTAQFTNAQRTVDTNAAQIEANISKQMAAMFTGTRKATEDEVAVIRAAAERNQKAVILHADGLKERLEALKKEVEDFNLEVDYVLSEANATTKVDVKLV